MKKEVCVITGGGSGMGLAAAKYMPKEKIILVTGRTLAKLERAVTELQEAGYEAYAKTCDTSVRSQVQELAAYAAELGEIKNVTMPPGFPLPWQILRNCSASMHWAPSISIRSFQNI